MRSLLLSLALVAVLFCACGRAMEVTNDASELGVEVVRVPASPLVREPPRSLDPAWATRESASLRHHFSPAFLCGNDAWDGSCLGESSTRIFLMRNVTVEWLGLVYGGQRVWHDPGTLLPAAWALPTVRERSDSLPVISLPKAYSTITRFSDTYYHFLIEAMPRLALAKPILDADHHFRIISHEHDFARSFLAELGFDGERVVSTGITTKNSHHKQPLFQVNELLVSAGMSMVAPQREPLWGLRKALGVRVLPASQRTKIIYVPRSAEWSRNVQNQARLLEELRLAFPAEEIVVFEQKEHSARSTIEFFQQAKLVIGPHGAGLANIIFAAPGTPIVELIFSSQPVLLYWHLAATMNQTYWAVPVPQASWGTNMIAPIEQTIATVARVLYGVPHRALPNACPAGTFRSSLGAACLSCSAGFVSEAAAEFCSICPQGSYSNGALSACESCPAGKGTWAVAPGFTNRRAEVSGNSSIDLVFQHYGASSVEDCVDYEYIERQSHREKRFVHLYAPPKIQILGGSGSGTVIAVDGSNMPNAGDGTLYDQVPLSVPTTHVFTIKNVGSSKLVITTLATSSSARFSTSYSKPLPFAVLPGVPQTVSVTFTGVLPDNINSVISIANNDPTAPNARFNVRAVPAPVAALPPNDNRACNPFCAAIPPGSRPPNVRCC